MDEPTIDVVPNGPYRVTGPLPLLRRRPVHSEHGEPITWDTTETVETRDTYLLCRCGQSSSKPFCDASHRAAGFETDDTVPPPHADGAKTLGGTGITVTDNRSVCVHAGFCGTRLTNVWKQVRQTDESTVRAAVIAEVERCPSGALTYEIDDRPVEPLLPLAIAAVDSGPLWVTGGVPVTIGSTTAERRNRVTLCRCGASSRKPLCDGSHKEIGFDDPAPA